MMSFISCHTSCRSTSWLPRIWVVWVVSMQQNLWNWWADQDQDHPEGCPPWREGLSSLRGNDLVWVCSSLPKEILQLVLSQEVLEQLNQFHPKIVVDRKVKFVVSSPNDNIVYWSSTRKYIAIWCKVAYDQKRKKKTGSYYLAQVNWLVRALQIKY